MPPAGNGPGRLQVVLHVLNLMFNEGYAATSGEQMSRPELTAEGEQAPQAGAGAGAAGGGLRQAPERGPGAGAGGSA
jgi:uncharacterized protein DUF6596